MAATLTDAQKKDLMTGNAKVLLVEQTDILTDTTFADADELYTIKDSLSIVENEPTKTPIQIDQNGGETIDNVYENGETLITGSAPTAAMEIFDYFYTKSKNQPTMGTGVEIDGTTYTKGSAYDLEKRHRKVSMVIISQSRKTAIAFMNVDLFAVFNWSNVNSTPTGVNFTGTVLGNGSNGGIIVLKTA